LFLIDSESKLREATAKMLEAATPAPDGKPAPADAGMSGMDMSGKNKSDAGMSGMDMSGKNKSGAEAGGGQKHD